MKEVPSEHQEAVWLAQYLELLKQSKKIKAYTHIPNETYTPSWAAKNRNRTEGLNAGFPDYVIVTQHEILFLELKKSKGGVVSAKQEAWIEALQSVGQVAMVCHGFDQAKQCIDAHLHNSFSRSEDENAPDWLIPTSKTRKQKGAPDSKQAS